MSKKDTKGNKNSADDYLANYREQLVKLQQLSQMSVRQFLGSRPTDDPRYVYMTALETFKNLANVQIAVLLRLIQKLGVSKEEFLSCSAEELENQVHQLESEFCVTGWDDGGSPVLDLQAYRQKTAAWPQ